MVMLNDLDRFHLVMDVIDRVPGLGERVRGAAPGDGTTRACAHRAYTRAYGDDPAEIRDWTWPDAAADGLRGPARTRAGPRRQRRARAASSCALLDDDDERHRAATRSTRRTSQLDTEQLRGALDATGSAAPTPSATASSTAASASTARSVSTPTVRAAARSALTDLAPLHQPKSLAALDAVAPIAARRAGGRLLRHRLPRDASRPPRRPTRSPRVARALGPAPLRLPRPLPRLDRAAGCRSCSDARSEGLRIVSCHLGAGASLCAIARRRLGRHHDGLHAARGARDGDPLGERRPRADAVAARSTGHPPRGADATRSSTARACSASAAAPTCARSSSARADGDGDARLAFDVYLHRLRGTIAAMAAALGGLDVLVVHRRRRRARGRRPRATADRLGFLGVAIDSERNAAAP